MTRIDHIEWASARVKGVAMSIVTVDIAGKPVPTMEVEVRYTWKSRSFSKRIRSILN